MKYYILLVLLFSILANCQVFYLRNSTNLNSCVNITTPLEQTQACMTFEITNSTSSCGGRMIFRIGNIILFDRDVSLSIPPKISVQFQGCALELKLVDINNAEGHFCAQLEATCGMVPLKTYSFGCVTDERLKGCVGCPNNCSNNGQCNNGVCTCNTGWSGFDCSERAPLFEKCMSLSLLSLDMCVRVRYGNCMMGYSFLVNNNTIATFYVPASQLKDNPQSKNCFNYLGCNMCLLTENFQGSTTNVYACLKLQVSCIFEETIDYGCMQQYGTFDWPCQSCPNNCNSNGQCQTNGSCLCQSGYFGDSCQFLRCKDDCNGNGVCNQGICECFSSYIPPYCAGQVTSSPTGHPGHSSSEDDGHHHIHMSRKAVAGVVFLVIVAVGAIGGAVFWYIKKRRSAQQNPLHFTSINDDEDV